MAQVTQNDRLINGQIKFSKKHSPEELCQLASEWKDGPEGNKIKFLAVRQCGTEQWGIAFTYEYDGTKQGMDKIIYKLTDKLLRRFGREVCWDITSSLWLIE